MASTTLIRQAMPYGVVLIRMSRSACHAAYLMQLRLLDVELSMSRDYRGKLNRQRQSGGPQLKGPHHQASAAGHTNVC